jgi:hypothetical protein
MAIVFGVSCLATADDVNTAKTGWVTVRKAGGNCTDERCKSDGGPCCNCETLRVFLPLGANVKAVRYYVIGESNGNPAQEVPLGQDLRWARFTDPLQSSSEKNVVVQVRFRNWRSDLDRQAAMEVDWTAPKPAK